MANQKNILKILKILSSKIKLDLIAHLFYCSCNECNVNDLTKIFKISQPNISNNLIWLRRNKVIKYKILKKERFYYLDEKFKEKYGNLISLLIKENQKYFEKLLCTCKNV
ncbi:ArsR/SmtB family transcription factor [Mesomycoplasma neurolyticum]|uniref:Predicted ArsR-family transcription repressor n=1 Tax=Mesomycoplasma neurolyticum TaxID=2120 RepID=A0A449A5F4_9BACT|nr:ArsR family transcriptional regulator [Mesomycoplasma neurolyticum]VEU59383.1 predicted ArsR-family transcription repressor [Mesomycoplasma neurolyticum]